MKMKSTVKLFMATATMLCATIVNANNNTCYANFTACNYFNKEQCSVAAYAIGDGTFQPCEYQQSPNRKEDIIGCQTDSGAQPITPPNKSQTGAGVCVTVDTTTQQPATPPSYADTNAQNAASTSGKAPSKP